MRKLPILSKVSVFSFLKLAEGVMVMMASPWPITGSTWIQEGTSSTIQLVLVFTISDTAAGSFAGISLISLRSGVI